MYEWGMGGSPGAVESDSLATSYRPFLRVLNSQREGKGRGESGFVSPPCGLLIGTTLNGTVTQSVSVGCGTAGH